MTDKNKKYDPTLKLLLILGIVFVIVPLLTGLIAPDLVSPTSVPVFIGVVLLVYAGINWLLNKRRRDL